MNEDGRKSLNCRWLAEVTLDALAVFGLRGSFLGHLSVLGLHPFVFRHGQQQRNTEQGNVPASEPLIGGLFCGRSFAPSWRGAFSGAFSG